MKAIIELLTSRVRKIRNNPDMASTHLALAIGEITDCLEALDTRLRAIESKQTEQESREKQRIDWSIGAMVPMDKNILSPLKAAGRLLDSALHDGYPMQPTEPNLPIFTKDNRPRLRKDGESIEDYRRDMGWSNQPTEAGGGK